MEPDDANFDDATLGVVSRYATTRFVFISLLRVHFIATTTTTSQAFFEWFWCLIFPFFFSRISNFENVRALPCRLSSLFSRPKDDDLTSLVFSLSPSQHVQSPSGNAQATNGTSSKHQQQQQTIIKSALKTTSSLFVTKSGPTVLQQKVLKLPILP